ncbi:unnamed protein product [Durusdinium trenchii]|uniref:Uncharacterized protein n=1 Tax=Durusdinium trenchii TaxID=1381693 RepID=A0ABP0M1N2_9DINO
MRSTALEGSKRTEEEERVIFQNCYCDRIFLGKDKQTSVHFFNANIGKNSTMHLALTPDAGKFQDPTKNLSMEPVQLELLTSAFSKDLNSIARIEAGLKSSFPTSLRTQYAHLA